METIGERIRRLRKERGWTLKQLAEQTSVTPQAIGQYEREERNPAFLQIIEIARAFNVAPAEITGPFKKIEIDEFLERDEEGLFDLLDKGEITPSFAETVLNKMLGQGLGKITFSFLTTWTKLNRMGRVKMMDEINDITAIPRYIKTDSQFREAHHGPEEEQ